MPLNLLKCKYMCVGNCKKIECSNDILSLDVLGGKKLDWPNLIKSYITMFHYLMSDENRQVNGFVFLSDFTGVGAKVIAKLLNREMGDFQSKWAVSDN